MQNFTFHSPTEVVFGRDSERQSAQKIKEYGGSRILIVYGGGSVIKSGLLQRIEKSFADADLTFESLGGVLPNPRLSFIQSAIEKAIEIDADFILAIGGGSVIDSAKAIAHGTANPHTNVWSFWTGEKKVEKSLPIGVVLTISAAGSETSDSAVLTNENTQSKVGLSTKFNRPKFAIMNPELTYTFPPYQVACGIVDIMMHTLDRYFTPTEGNELTDEIAEAVLRTTIRNGTIAMNDMQNYQAVSELMWCGSISHNGLTGLGAVRDFATHKLGHELSAKFDVAHGASLSAVWGSWAAYVYQEKPVRFVQFSEKVLKIKKTSDDDTARAAIKETVAFFRSLDMPTCFSELGIGLQSYETLRNLADHCVSYGKPQIGGFKLLTSEDIYSIYQMANY